MIYLNKCCGKKHKKKKCDGRKVIYSAILFENGVSKIISTEAKLIDRLIERNENPWKLIKLNKQIAKIICCLKDFEEKIVWKIKNEQNQYIRPDI